MERKIYETLLVWKNSPDRKPMVLEGARQVGKTYILKEFGRREYENLVYVNCHKNKYMEDLFSIDFDTERIIRGLSAYTAMPVNPGKTLIFIDEIQDAPHALESLKYFCEDAREQHIVVAGSLLGTIDHEDESYPVGKINTYYMFPMSFEEFLWAKGERRMAELIDNQDWTNMNALAPKFQDLLRQYYFVGGMPEVVKSYVENGDLIKVREIQNQILSDYNSDFSKHAKSEAPRIRMVWRSLPSQLAKENKKFIYGVVKKGARAKEFETALQWLVDSGLVYIVPRCRRPSIPLAMYEDLSAFKVYMNDVGLLGAMANMPAKLMLISNDVFKEAKGAFTENYVIQQLENRRRADMSFYYYSKDNSTMKIDFLVQTDERVVPLEVKAEENVNSKSLRNFITNEFEECKLKGLRCSMKSYIDQDWMENIPLYAVGGYFRNNHSRISSTQV